MFLWRGVTKFRVRFDRFHAFEFRRYTHNVAGPLKIRTEVLQEVRERVLQTPRLEVCGLLAGSDDVITQSYAATNSSLSPASSYEIAPDVMFSAMRAIRAANLKFMGIYHSHPNGKSEPSDRDLALAFYPDVAYLIFAISTSGDDAYARAFTTRDGKAAELKLEISPAAAQA